MISTQKHDDRWAKELLLYATDSPNKRSTLALTFSGLTPPEQRGVGSDFASSVGSPQAKYLAD